MEERDTPNVGQGAPGVEKSEIKMLRMEIQVLAAGF